MSNVTDDDDKIVKNSWTPEEDALLREQIQKLEGPGNWTAIAEALPGRSSKSCRLRWCNQLNPMVKRGPFTEDEDRAILVAHAIHGNKWAVISRSIPGRTDNQVKNRFNSTLRRLFANQTSIKPAGMDVATKKRKLSSNDGKSGKRTIPRGPGVSSPKSATDSDDDIITGLEQLVQASLEVEKHTGSGGEESDDERNVRRGKAASGAMKEIGESSVRGARAFSDLATLAAKGFAGVPGISSSQMAATAAAFENYQKVAQAASYAAGIAPSAVPGLAGGFGRHPSFHHSGDAPSSQSTGAFPGALAAFGGNAAAAQAAASANPLLASLVQAQNQAAGGLNAMSLLGGANQALLQQILLQAQVKASMAPPPVQTPVQKASAVNGSEASDMSAHGGTAWAAAMAAMGPQMYAQMLGNPAFFGAAAV